MNDIVVLKMPFALVLIGAVVLLHVACTVVGRFVKGGASRVITLVLAVLNGAAHLGLIAYSMIKDVPTDELLCLLMLSAAVGMICIGISKKMNKAEEDEKNGI